MDGLPAEVLSASDTLLTVQIPQQAAFAAEAALIVTSSGLVPDTIPVIASENPLAEVTGLSPAEGPAGTVVTVFGSNFNPDTASYAFIYEDPDEGFFIPRHEDGTFRNTLRAAYPDSLLIQIPEGFHEGRIHFITATQGAPIDTHYQLATPRFTVTP